MGPPGPRARAAAVSSGRISPRTKLPEAAEARARRRRPRRQLSEGRLPPRPAPGPLPSGSECAPLRSPDERGAVAAPRVPLGSPQPPSPGGCSVMAALRAEPSGGRAGGACAGSWGSRTPQSAAPAPPSRPRHPGRWVWAPARRPGGISGSAQAPVSPGRLSPLPMPPAFVGGGPGQSPASVLGLAGGGPSGVSGLIGGGPRPRRSVSPGKQVQVVSTLAAGRMAVALGPPLCRSGFQSAQHPAFRKVFDFPRNVRASPMAGLRRGAPRSPGRRPRHPFCCVTRRGAPSGGSSPQGPAV